jgi:hypothetical protein
VSKYQVSTTASAISSMWKWRGPAGDCKCWGAPGDRSAAQVHFDESAFDLGEVEPLSYLVT